MRRETAYAAAVTFVASFCTLVIEISAGRVLAPFVGVSLYTWTSIIGIVLAGISLGAWLGGLLADRRPAHATLGIVLLVAGLATAGIAPLAEALAADEGLLTSAGIAMTLVSRVVVLTVLLFFLPALFLGMVSPVAVKLAVRDLGTTGRTVGAIYAVSTVGSIAGTFVTGFWLVAQFGTRATLFGVGIVLVAAALVFGGFFPRRVRAVAAVVLVAGLALAAVWPRDLAPPYLPPLTQPGETGFLHDEESQYYRIRVERMLRRETGAPLYALHLDHLIHSYSDPADPEYLHYEYLQIFDGVAARTMARRSDPRILFVGGGGYTLPRLLATRYPHARIDVVEIDPAVTRVAQRWFGLDRHLRIRTIAEDARWFAMRSRDAYDLVLIDAFNDLSVPSHLTTREATRDLRRLLRPGGAILANVIDNYESGRFLASYVKTLRDVFPEGETAVVLIEAEDVEAIRSTFVPIVSEDLGLHLPDGWPLVRGAQLHGWVARRGGIILTDDHAPVDKMLAPLFKERGVEDD